MIYVSFARPASEFKTASHCRALRFINLHDMASVYQGYPTCSIGKYPNPPNDDPTPRHPYPICKCRRAAYVIVMDTANMSQELDDCFGRTGFTMRHVSERMLEVTSNFKETAYFSQPMHCRILKSTPHKCIKNKRVSQNPFPWSSFWITKPSRRASSHRTYPLYSDAMDLASQSPQRNALRFPLLPKST